MHFTNKELRFNDLVFRIPDEVYEPAEDSLLFADNFQSKEGSRVLDMGTGCGILGIIAAKNAANVLAVDINPHAIRCARQNAVANELANRMSFLQADLFNGLAPEIRFDLIIFNAPYLPCRLSNDTSWLEKAWAGGRNGREVIDRFIRDAPGRLSLGGEILLMQSRLSDRDKTVSNLAGQRLRVNIVAERELPFFEKLLLIRALASG
jgi:release factor glutamine methyltransferase